MSTKRYYAIRSREYYIGERRYLDEVLVELEGTEKEIADQIEAEKDAAGTRHTRIHYTRAHDWVRRGYRHETPLYLDGNFIRYAQG